MTTQEFFCRVNNPLIDVTAISKDSSNKSIRNSPPHLEILECFDFYKI